MVWLGVGMTVVVCGCLLYYTRSARTKKPHDAVFLPPKSLSSESKSNDVAESTAIEPQNLNIRKSAKDKKPTRTDKPPPSTATFLPITEHERPSTTQQPPQQNGQAVQLLEPQPAPAATSFKLTEPPRLKPPTFSSMPPPPRPTFGSALRPSPSPASTLRVPPTKVLANTSMAPSLLTPSSSKPSRKVMLAPGHSPLDWAILTSKPNNKLRGKEVPDNFVRVPPSALRYHNGRKGRDAWTEYRGKVYNITPYLPFHPGGEGELMRGAGKDSAKLFMEVHPWVNWEGILAECLIGVLVNEGEEAAKPGGESNELDEMD